MTCQNKLSAIQKQSLEVFVPFFALLQTPQPSRVPWKFSNGRDVSFELFFLIPFSRDNTFIAIKITLGKYLWILIRHLRHIVLFVWVLAKVLSWRSDWQASWNSWFISVQRGYDLRSRLHCLTYNAIAKSSDNGELLQYGFLLFIWIVKTTNNDFRNDMNNNDTGITSTFIFIWKILLGILIFL